MNPEQQKIFDSTPEDEPRSRLEPYRELILRWRRQGRTYRRICSLLHDSFAVKISYFALYQFVSRRSRPRKPQPEPETAQLTLTPTAPPVTQAAAIPRNPQTQPDEDRWAEQRERMRRHKEAPAAQVPLKVFQVNEEDLDCTKPLRMMSPTPKEK